MHLIQGRRQRKEVISSSPLLEFLRHEPKWHQHMIKLATNKSSQKKQKTLDDSVLDLIGNPNDEMANADNNGNATLDGDAPKRPMGRKKAKQLLRQGGGDACI
jgi:hypothetical protein